MTLIANGPCLRLVLSGGFYFGDYFPFNLPCGRFSWQIFNATAVGAPPSSTYKLRRSSTYLKYPSCFVHHRPVLEHKKLQACDLTSSNSNQLSKFFLDCLGYFDSACGMLFSHWVLPQPCMDLYGKLEWSAQILIAVSLVTVSCYSETVCHHSETDQNPRHHLSYQHISY